jgi:hypothetical protein
MSATTSIARGWLLAAVGLAACGASEFSLKDTTALELGRLREDEYRSLFGRPSSERSATEIDGERRIVWFENGPHGAQSCARTLRLEFNERRLNAYLGSSSCSDDRTSVDATAIDALKLELGKRTREELARTMPRPAGKARCPSALSEYKKRCGHGADEVWAWLSASDPLGAQPGAPTTLGLVSFDTTGKLQDARIEEYQRAGSR